MEKYKLNHEKIKLYTIILAFIVLFIYVFASIRNIKSASLDTPDISTDVMLNGNGNFSYGYDHGNVYSIDGKEISYNIKIGKEERHAGLPGFSSVLGIEGFSDSGLINKCCITLHSSANKANVDLKTGNNIQTTLSYKGQTVASALLEEYFPQEICEGAELAVVLKDGTVIVAAGSNGYDVSKYDFSDISKIPQDMCIDRTATTFAIGSVAKVFTGATLLANDKSINNEYSLYNENFEDFSFYSHGGVEIGNHDRSVESAYESVYNENTGQMIRHIDLVKAYILSSNVYFWRHALNFGLDRTYKAMDKLFFVSQPVRTEINTLIPLEADPERYDYLFWGQNFVSNTVVCSSMVNSIFSGKRYTPFYIASVSTPDNTEIYRATPEPASNFPIDDKAKNMLISSLSDCFRSYCQNMDYSVYEKYTDLINDNRILSKSGTADVIENEIVNHTRIITILDENHNTVCTATIGVNRASNKCNASNNVLYSIIFSTLEATGIL